MENTVASFYLNGVSHWRIRFLHNTKQMNSQSSLVLAQWCDKIAFLSKAEEITSCSALHVTTDYHSCNTESKKLSLLPLEVMPSSRFMLQHIHLQPVILSPVQLQFTLLLA